MRLAIGLGVGLLVSMILMLLVLGVRPDIGRAATTAIFWIKGAYTLALAGIAIWAAERLARPAEKAGRRLAWFALPLAAVISLALVQIAAASPQVRNGMIIGSGPGACLKFMILLSLPPFVGLVWAMRGLAPTRLWLTGAVCGIAAGGAGSFVFTFACTESTAAFLAAWYTLGVVAVAVAGALVGSRVLHWPRVIPVP
jgi:hypothetical protein